LPNVIKEHLFELNEVPQAMAVASSHIKITASHAPRFEPPLRDVKRRGSKPRATAENDDGFVRKNIRDNWI
jgi:hypothetical protein